MAFENTTVLNAVLDACEPDTAIREASMELRGLPLEYAFRANSSLDYLGSKAKSLDSLNEYIFEEITFYSETSILNFVDFGSKVSALYEKHECIRDNVSEAAIEYLGSSGQLTEKHCSDIADSIEFIYRQGEVAVDFSSVMKKAYDISLCYGKQLREILCFLANGPFMDEDAPQNKVDAWIDTFNLFTKLKNIKYKLMMEIVGKNGV
jgi:hypothetical protein